ncbi:MULTISPECIES: excalibur calcium-binding domain-containing protein [unclassified Sporosarcina]|uniref:excalibur calcium-binding domain-containing protein n=1 Tax=unclassified Sporosarcina TaxID=2647733 RepID=UPI000C16C833|nr:MULTISPECIES: excalibur calcium-binding domain-containing protein [unclassified Sporosarcina]PID05885.1 calcium-binding protein [Sporosarcina sp. P30]PID09079.1 calcium-binding protein [Sporosarcina sp. P31]PID12376.1 calcium-binding protein [Sporosarcina sp. P32b]
MIKLSKKVLPALLACSIVLLPVQSTEAAAAKFKNCTQLNKSYPGGVAMNATVKNKGGKTKLKPAIAASVYNSHKSLDRDKDGIACER